MRGEAKGTEEREEEGREDARKGGVKKGRGLRRVREARHPFHRVEWDAQPHQPVVFKLSPGDHRVGPVEQEALLAGLRSLLALGDHGAADDVLGLKLLHHLEGAGEWGEGLDEWCADDTSVSRLVREVIG